MAELYLNRECLYFSPRLSRKHRDDLLHLRLEDVGPDYNLAPSLINVKDAGVYEVRSATPKDTRLANIRVSRTETSLVVGIQLQSSSADLVLSTTVQDGEPEAWTGTKSYPLPSLEWVELEVDLYDRTVLAMLLCGRERIFESPSTILRAADRFDRIERGIL